MSERRYDFMDTRIIEHTYFLERSITPVTKYPGNPVIEPGIAMQTVLKQKSDGLRMWYATRKVIPRPGGEGLSCEYILRLAESNDGRTWTFPDLGRKGRDGNGPDNVLIAGNDADTSGEPLTGWVGPEGFCVMDAEAGPAPKVRGRFTAMYLTNLPGRQGGLCLAHSKDGLHWLAYPENPVFPGWQDMFNNFFFDGRIGRYVLYYRPEVHAGPRWANRLVSRAESDDLVHWDHRRVVLDTDGRDASAVGTVDEGDGYPRGRDFQFYGMTVTPYNGLYLGFATYYDVIAGRNSQRLVHSFDGIEWRREAVEEDFIPPGPGAWDGVSTGFVQAGCPVKMGDELYFYYGGNNICHHESVAHHGDQSARRGLGLGIVPRGRLVGYHAGEEPGELLTRAFELTGGKLVLNTSAAGGEVRVAMTDEHGTALTGLSLNDTVPIREDSLAAPVRWTDETALSELRGKRIRLRIAVRRASVYGFSVLEHV